MADSSMAMETTTKGSGKMIRLRELEPTRIQTVLSTLVNGLTIDRRGMARRNGLTAQSIPEATRMG
jgi:hypothetical protein